MPLFLSNRDVDSRELMDSPDCDIQALNNTYRQFRVINALISRWRHIYLTKIRPLLQDRSRQASLLDIGFGGGDIPIKLALWAQEDGIDLRVTGIETDARAYRFAKTLDSPQNVRYIHASSTELLETGRQFDVVISNHLLHHLDQQTLLTTLSEARQLSRRAVFFNDIERSDVGYFLFNLFARPVFRSSFITSDGLTSIKRSYTLAELRRAVPSEWKVQRLLPYRLLLTYHHA